MSFLFAAHGGSIKLDYQSLVEKQTCGDRSA